MCYENSKRTHRPSRPTCNWPKRARLSLIFFSNSPPLASISTSWPHPLGCLSPLLLRIEERLVLFFLIKFVVLIAANSTWESQLSGRNDMGINILSSNSTDRKISLWTSADNLCPWLRRSIGPLAVRCSSRKRSATLAIRHEISRSLEGLKQNLGEQLDSRIESWFPVVFGAANISIVNDDSNLNRKETNNLPYNNLIL